MLTDPLELGPCGDGHGARIMEDCLLGDTRVSLPEDLLEDVSYIITLFSSLSLPTATVLILCSLMLRMKPLFHSLYCSQSDLCLFLWRIC